MRFNKNPLRQARNPNSQLPISDDKVKDIVKNLGIYQPSQELEATIRVVGSMISDFPTEEEVQEQIDGVQVQVDNALEYAIEAKSEAELATTSAAAAIAVTDVLTSDVGGQYIKLSIPNSGIVRTVEQRAQDYINLRDYGAVGDGITNDSVAFNKFIADCQARGITGLVPKGRYLIPNATKVTMTGNLCLVGDGQAQSILDGAKTVPNQYLNLTQYNVVVEGISFYNFVDVFAAGNGSGGSMDNSLTGDVGLFRLSDVGFDNCRRGTFCFVSKTGPTLGKLSIQDCTFDGRGVAYSGLYFAWTNIREVNVFRNTVKSINATAAGFTSGGTPQNIGNGRGMLIGGNYPPDNYTAARWSVCDNQVFDVTDSRNKAAGVNPEVGAIRVTGARFVEICRNRISNVSSTGSGVDDDCEGIYPKASYSIICNNVLDNVGNHGGSIYVKGYDRAFTGQEPGDLSAEGWAGIVSGNVIRRTTSRGCGISIYSCDWRVENNYIEGCGGDTSRYAPIWVNSGQNDNTVIRGNSIRNSVGPYGILMTAYGRNIRIEGNTIDGVLANYPGLAAQHTYGIYVLNVNSGGYNTTGIPLDDLLIHNNTISGLVTMAGNQSRAIAINSSGSPSNRVRICDNVVASTTTEGVTFFAGTYNGVTLNNNDLRAATTRYATSGSPVITDLAALGNLGWLSGSVVINPPSVASMATLEIGTVAITNAATRDFVRVSSSSGLSGMFLWAAVTGTGVVSLYLFNPTAAAIDMPSSTFRVTVEKGSV